MFVARLSAAFILMCLMLSRCQSDGKCLKASQFCDGISDCDDGSDEWTNLTSSDGLYDVIKLCSGLFQNRFNYYYHYA